MTNPGDSNDPIAYLGLDRARISSLQRLLADLADFFDTADHRVADAVDHHFDIGDADGWLSIVLADHVRMLDETLLLPGASRPREEPGGPRRTR